MLSRVCPFWFLRSVTRVVAKVFVSARRLSAVREHRTILTAPWCLNVPFHVFAYEPAVFICVHCFVRPRIARCGYHAEWRFAAYAVLRCTALCALRAKKPTCNARNCVHCESQACSRAAADRCGCVVMARVESNGASSTHISVVILHIVARYHIISSIL